MGLISRIGGVRYILPHLCAALASLWLRELAENASVAATRSEKWNACRAHQSDNKDFMIRCNIFWESSFMQDKAS